MSNLILNQDGTINMILDNQIELSAEEKKELTKLESTLGQLTNAEMLFKQEAKRLELSLMNNPEYQKLQKIREKTKTVRQLQRRTKILLEAQYDKVFQRHGIPDKTEKLLQAIPDPPPPKKRGRPRLIPTNGRAQQ